MSSKGSPVRLVVALSVASMLAIFLVYTSLAGGTTLSLKPSQLAGHAGTVMLIGEALGPISGDAAGSGLHFRLRDIGGTAEVPVVYRGSVPDLFGATRHVFLSGRLENGVFVAQPGSLVTKCPSKYVAEPGT